MLNWWRSLFTWMRRLSARAARRASASALRRFTLAQCAAALALVALTFALLTSRKMSLSLETPPAEPHSVAPLDAGAPLGQDVTGAAEHEPARDD
jgi:hypothetical protein